MKRFHESFRAYLFSPKSQAFYQFLFIRHIVFGVKGSRPDRTGVTVLPRGDIGDLRSALAILQGR